MVLQVGEPVTEPQVLLLQLPVLSQHEPQLAVGSLGLPQLPLQPPLYVVNVSPEISCQRSLGN